MIVADPGTGSALSGLHAATISRAGSGKLGHLADDPGPILSQGGALRCAPGSDVRLCVQVEVHEADFFYSLGIDQVQHDHADEADDHEAADPQRHFGIRR